MENEKQVRVEQIFSHGGELFPVDFQQAMDEAVVQVEPLPPVLGRNHEPAFHFQPFDQVRVAELLATMKRLGFCVLEMRTKQQTNEYGTITVTFGQVTDPRTKV